MGLAPHSTLAYPESSEVAFLRTIQSDNETTNSFIWLPVIGTISALRKASLSRGPWNNGVGAPLCRESPFTGAERNGLNQSIMLLKLYIIEQSRLIDLLLYCLNLWIHYIQCS